MERWTIDKLIRRGYRIYDIPNLVLTQTKVNYFRNVCGIEVFHDEGLKLILVKDAESKGRL